MSHLLEEYRDGVAVLTLNRPESRNAFSGEMLESPQRAISQAESDSSVRVVVLTGSGRAFSAGGDVKGFPGVREQESNEPTGEDRRPTV